ncbi:MAG: spermidine/putrescine ABC transporter substrate-binding protein, partial [Defluviitaleaceae bacterium]|nr:spermidine/putrescine ABC transporter substrate-binding protein [Defluviitaleaceae bacterium]
MKNLVKKLAAAALVLTMLVSAAALSSCRRDEEADYGNGAPVAGDRLYFFNWMEFVDTDVLDMFYEEYGITVILQTYTSNEMLHILLRDGGEYDVIVP